MNKSGTRSASHGQAGRSAWTASCLEHTAFLLLVLVAALRPMIAETYDSATDPFDAAIAEIQNPSPVRTVAFDVVILGAALLAAGSRIVGPIPFRRTGLLAGLALAAIAACISLTAASNKRLAINASLDWICIPVAALALVQVTRRPWQMRLLLGAILATAAVQAFQCFDQYATFDDTWADYLERKDEFWAAQGVDQESERVALFEQRIKANEAGGFFAHSNVAAAYMVLCGFVGLGAAMAFWPRRRSPDESRQLDSGGASRSGIGQPIDQDRSMALAFCAMAFAVSGFVFAAVALTGSLGGWMSAGLAAACFAAVLLLWNPIARHPLSAWLVAWAAVIGGCVGVISYGVFFDRLPGASLTFRWEYWKASLEMIGDHLWTGVGRENFGRHYLQYKPIHAPEEIANPHNLLIQVAAEFGLIGAVGVMTLIVRGSIIAGRALVGAGLGHRCAGTEAADDRWSRRYVVLSGIVLLGVLGVVRAICMGVDDANLVYYTTVVGTIIWGTVYLLFALPSWSSGGSRPVRIGLTAGLVSFLIHDMINFAAFVPAASTTFFMIFGALCCFRPFAARGMDEAVPYRQRRQALTGALTLLGLLLVAVGSGYQVLSAGRKLAAGRQLAAAGHSGAAIEQFRAAAQADPFDPAPLSDAAELLLEMANASDRSAATRSSAEILNDAETTIRRAIQRDPASVGLRRQLVNILLGRAARTGETATYTEAVEEARGILELYPLSPPNMVWVGEVELSAAESASDPAVGTELARAAADRLAGAVRLDDARPKWEKHRRLSLSERAAIERGLERARAVGN